MLLSGIGHICAEGARHTNARVISQCIALEVCLDRHQSTLLVTADYLKVIQALHEETHTYASAFKMILAVAVPHSLARSERHPPAMPLAPLCTCARYSGLSTGRRRTLTTYASCYGTCSRPKPSGNYTTCSSTGEFQPCLCRPRFPRCEEGCGWSGRVFHKPSLLDVVVSSHDQTTRSWKAYYCTSPEQVNSPQHSSPSC